MIKVGFVTYLKRSPDDIPTISLEECITVRNAGDILDREITGTCEEGQHVSFFLADLNDVFLAITAITYCEVTEGLQQRICYETAFSLASLSDDKDDGADIN